MNETITRADCLARDAQDPLAPLRARFDLPDGVIYLDGNSLGPLPRATPAAMTDAMGRQWGERLIRGWNEGWIDAPQRVGAKLDGVLRSHQLLPDGSRRDTVVYSILDIEWPSVRNNLRFRLDRGDRRRI